VQLQEQAPLVLLVLPGLPAVDQVALTHTHELLEQRRTRRDHPVGRALRVQRGGGGGRAPCRFLPLASLLPVPAVLPVQSIQPLEPLDSTLSWPRLHVALHVRRHLGCRRISERIRANFDAPSWQAFSKGKMLAVTQFHLTFLFDKSWRLCR